MQIHVNEERLDRVVLTWLWCKGGKPATGAVVATGMKGLLAQESAKDLVLKALERLDQSGTAERIAPATKTGSASFKITDVGIAGVRKWLGREEPPTRTPFAAIGGYELSGMALDLNLPPHDAKSQKAFAKLLPLAVCVREFQLVVPLDRGPDSAKIELVKIALSKLSGVTPDRIYLKKLPPGVLPALVAGPLLGEPGTAVANLDKLVVAVASRILDGCKATQIKTAVVRRWLADDMKTATPVLRYSEEPDSSVADPALRSTSEPASADSPIDLATFSRQALAAAEAVARGRGSGVSALGDKVLTLYAWREYEGKYGPMQLERFKKNLSDANGEYLALVREDLIPEDRIREFTESEVRTGVSRYHYIRVKKTGETHA